MTPRRISPRTTKRLLAAVVLLLTLLLCALLGMLGNIIHSTSALAGSAPVAGLRSLRVILGPGVGRAPLFDSPMGAAFGKDGRIYVADTGNNRIVVFDSRGKYLFQFGGLGVGKPAPGGRPSWKPGRFNYPTDVAVDEQGNVYVADFRNDQIQVFDAEGKFARVFPDRNKPVGKGASGQDGTGIAVTSLAVRDGQVYATDKYQVMVFDTNGGLVEQFGKPGRGPSDLDHPNGVAVAPDSTMVVSDSDHNRIIGFGPAGAALWTLGKPSGSALATAGSDSAPGRTTLPFDVPRGLTRTDDGTAIVADALACQLVRVSASGGLLKKYGQRGVAPGELNFPTDVDSLRELLLIAEKGNNRVQVVVIDEP
jgi:DNA-binding beta-propeller fold protein YncE